MNNFWGDTHYDTRKKVSNVSDGITDEFQIKNKTECIVTESASNIVTESASNIKSAFITIFPAAEI